MENARLNLDQIQARQAKDQKNEFDKALNRTVRDTYRWLMSPVQEVRKGRLDPKIVWDAVQVSATAPNLIAEIERLAIDNGWLIAAWSPIHLAEILKTWYFKDGAVDVGALKVWQDCCHYLYLPRLMSSLVYGEAVRIGAESEDFFGYASGKEGDAYLGLIFGRSSLTPVDGSAFLIQREKAGEIKASQTPEPGPGPSPDPQPGPDAGPGAGPSPAPTVTTGPGPQPAPKKTRFYGTVQLDPVKAKLVFAQIADEVLQPFLTKPNAKVTVSIEIQAEDPQGFDEGTQRAVRENCAVLKFGTGELEAD